MTVNFEGDSDSWREEMFCFFRSNETKRHFLSCVFPYKTMLEWLFRFLPFLFLYSFLSLLSLLILTQVNMSFNNDKNLCPLERVVLDLVSSLFFRSSFSVLFLSPSVSYVSFSLSLFLYFETHDADYFSHDFSTYRERERETVSWQCCMSHLASRFILQEEWWRSLRSLTDSQLLIHVTLSSCKQIG